MPVLILCRYDQARAAERVSLRRDHLRYMIAAKAQTLLGGALMDGGGAVTGLALVLNVIDIGEARAFIAGEPYSKAGLVEAVEMHDLRLAVPEPWAGYLESEMQRESALRK